MLMQGVSVLLTGYFNRDVFILSLPLGFLTVNILHSNNQRDIDNDVLSNIKSLAYHLRNNSYNFYKFNFIISYLIPLIFCLSSNNKWLDDYRIFINFIPFYGQFIYVIASIIKYILNYHKKQLSIIYSIVFS